ncbi:flavin reductase family protein [Actinoplanes utahensis]|uniref:flavin reductase family protein n=1 Tax=Actinoplanes utahensis TaxID=1869 RepID=UPI000A007167|nr:flavin reductase family protein [Actinoplanes utahensis]GIF32757.1 putative oxidoreductase [Actinoplanes utahensis]
MTDFEAIDMTGSTDLSASAPAADSAPPAARELRHAFAGFATGITVVAALVDGRPTGMPANSFSSISLDPPLAALSFARTSTTWPLLRRAPQWGISVLGEHHKADLARLSRPAAERFDGVSWVSSHGAVFLEHARTTFRVGVAAEVDAGDHVLTLLRIHALRRSTDGGPLIFYNNRLHGLKPEQS